MLSLRARSVLNFVSRRNTTSLNQLLRCCASNLVQRRPYSGKTENTWEDGAIRYSTSKASKHKVNSTIGLDEKKEMNYKPVIFGTLTFTVLMYIMFVYHGEKNDVFVTITPESVREQYLQAVNQTNVMYVAEDEEKKDG